METPTTFPLNEVTAHNATAAGSGVGSGSAGAVADTSGTAVPLSIGDAGSAPLTACGP